MKEKRHLFLIIECQLINVAGVMVTENGHLVTTIMVVNLGKNHQCLINQMNRDLMKCRILA